MIQEMLYSGFSIIIWLTWWLFATIMGYLIASTRDSSDAAALVAGTAIIGGVSGMLFGDGILEGAKDWTLSLISSVFLIPVWPALYLLPFGWQLGELAGLAWLGALVVATVVTLGIAIVLVIAWIVVLRLVGEQLPHFLTGLIAPSVFLPAPVLCLFAL